jgi:formamidopyrimidine-DNA glycosylase
LQEALGGRVIEGVEFRRKSGGLSPAVEARVLGARVRRVRTFGKHLVVDFTRGVHLHNHMMMFGKWRTYPRAAYDSGCAKPPPRSRRWRGPRSRVGPTVADVRDDSRVRLVLRTADVVAVEFNGPVLSFTTCDPARRQSIRRLGPDALATPFDAAEARRRLRARGRKTLADLLLDQSFVAGIGNKYKSEILWQLGLDPFMRASALARREITRLLAEIPATLRRGYLQAGRTRPLEDGESAASWNHKHWVFRRGGRSCWTCGTPVMTDRARSARVTFLCPTCQPTRPAASRTMAGARTVRARAASRTRRPIPSCSVSPPRTRRRLRSSRS